MLKSIIILVFSIIFTSDLVLAGCGGCGPSRVNEKKVSGLVENLPKNNFLKGNVLISCGMCNFMTNTEDCSLAIKIGSNVLNVSGVGIDDHGDSHAIDGYCNVIKKVYVEGKVEGKSFKPTTLKSLKI
tara:strand:+ start:245 stop:628 length:384 start_codon:yes stop_codon:yes gene_type:complete